jgi:hypothetical protein
MEDPAHPGYPQELLNTVGPRNMVHSWATNVDDPTVDPRWGKVGKQKIEDAGTLYPKRMETVDDEIRDLGKHRTMRTLATVWQPRRKVEAMTAPDRGLVCQQPRLY